MARTSADVAIIGGGLIGAFAAYFLRQHRRSVIVIEKATAAAAASGRNFGNLRLQGHDPLEFPLALRAQAIWEALPQLTGEDCGLRGCGHAYLALSAADAGKLDQIVRQGQAAGLAIEHLDGAPARSSSSRPRSRALCARRRALPSPLQPAASAAVSSSMPPAPGAPPSPATAASRCRW